MYTLTFLYTLQSLTCSLLIYIYIYIWTNTRNIVYCYWKLTHLCTKNICSTHVTLWTLAFRMWYWDTANLWNTAFCPSNFRWANARSAFLKHPNRISVLSGEFRGGNHCKCIWADFCLNFAVLGLGLCRQEKATRAAKYQHSRQFYSTSTYTAYWSDLYSAWG